MKTIIFILLSIISFQLYSKDYLFEYQSFNQKSCFEKSMEYNSYSYSYSYEMYNKSYNKGKSNALNAAIVLSSFTIALDLTYFIYFNSSNLKNTQHVSGDGLEINKYNIPKFNYAVAGAVILLTTYHFIYEF